MATEAAPATPKAGGKEGSKASGKGKKGKQAAASRIAEKQTEKIRRTAPSRLRQIYLNELRAKLQAELGLKNIMEVPKLVKVTLNMGLGDAVANPKILDNAVEELALIAGQMPVVTRAKKAIATYKLREGQKIGAMVTLRQDTMYEFLDRLISFSLPRVRDFKGISPKGFDGRGNFTMGVREGIIFPEASFEGMDKARGMNISIVTTARTDEQARALLRHLGMPFRN